MKQKRDKITYYNTYVVNKAKKKTVKHENKYKTILLHLVSRITVDDNRNKLQVEPHKGKEFFF